MIGADLIGADLRSAELSGAKLFRADLSRADLNGTTLVQQQVNEAKGDENTKLSKHLQRPAHWTEGSEMMVEEEDLKALLEIAEEYRAPWYRRWFRS